MKKEAFKHFFVFCIFAFLLYFGFLFLSTEPPKEAKKYLSSVHFLDVGQGDAVLLEVDSTTQLLIDGGPSRKLLEELGRLMPYNDKVIEHVILSHAHADHFMGLFYLFDNYQVKTLYLSKYGNPNNDFQAFLARARAKNVNIIIVGKGDVLNFGRFKANIYWPKETYFADQNDSSLVFSMEKLGSKILFTGDVGYRILENVIPYGSFYDIYKVSHHGSKTGTSQKSIEKINPKYAVISLGKNNRYNHPHPSVLGFLSRTHLLRTDVLGTITFKIGEAGIFLY